MLAFTGPHGPVGSFVVRVSTTLPFAISAAVGMYTAVSEWLSGINVPLPPLQLAELALPPMLPARLVAGAPAQTFLSGPAETVAGMLMVTAITSFTARHGPGGSFVVTVSVTVPATRSAALGE